MTLFSGGSSLTQKEHLIPGETFLAKDTRVHDLFALGYLFFKFILFLAAQGLLPVGFLLLQRAGATL